MKTEASSILLSPDVPFPSANPLASRVFSASELLLGAFIVIGHNVFHIVPNEVIVLLVLVWTFAAFGEEIAYRGYLLTRAADIGRRSRAAYWIGIVLVSILFGYGHYYKGTSGVIDSGVAGLILGTVYMLAGRNLWACILTHGFIDTFGVIDAFFGWSK